MAHSDDEDPPLTSSQRRMWFLERMQPGTARHTLPLRMELAGPLDRGRLQDALDALLARHPPLRTAFVDAAGVPEARVAPPGPFPLEIGPSAEHSRSAPQATSTA